MIFNESSCNFFSYCKPTPHILMKVLDFDILPKNVSDQSEYTIF